MPAAPTPSFSYDQDIAPHASRFFDRIDASTTLSHGAKMRIQGTLLNGMEDIETQRLKLQEERDQGRARKLDYESGTFRLEQARADRARTEAQDSRRAGIAGIARGILDSKDDPETKRQKLARTALDYADDDDALKTFGVAEKAIPTKRDSLLSDASELALILDGIPQDELAYAKESGDYSRVGQMSRKLKVDHEAAVENKRIGLSQDNEARAVKLGLAKTPLKFAKNPDVPGEDSDWLEDESTSHATAIVQTLGDDAEMQKFLALKGAASDRDRAALVQSIQLRHLQKAAEGRDDSDAKGAAAPTRGARYMFKKNE